MTVTKFRMAALYAVIPVLLSACSQFSTRPLPVAYHNLTARYNAYLIARDNLRQIDRTLFQNRQENYAQPLPILLPLDSNALAPVRAQLDDAIKKASMVAERHQNSKWLDDSYVLLGKARLLRQDYINATEVFKYVNTKGRGEAEKHEALVGLMRAYVEQGDYSNALNVAEYLRAQPLSKENTRDYYLTKAYLHQRRGENAVAAALLEETFPLLDQGEATARLHLIAGQLQEQLGKPELARKHFAAVQRNRPSYEQSFYADIYLMDPDPKVSQPRLNRMLSDRKNADLKDKIYLTMGQQEARRGNYPQAILYWQQAIQVGAANTAQIPFTYLEMAGLYADKLHDYGKAKAYYDSTLALLPPQSPNFADVQKRKKVLDEFVRFQSTITLEDSLQQLARLNPAALDRRLDQLVESRWQEQQRQQADAERIVGQATAAGGPAATSDIDPMQKWHLYNPTTISQGRIEFIQKWGNRPLEDNWRRDANESQLTTETMAANSSGGQNGIPEAAAPGTLSDADRRARKEQLYASIPLTPDALRLSNQRLEESMYNLGKLYKISLNQPEKSIATFSDLLTRFPATSYKPEIYYLQMLSHDQLKQPSSWKEKLLAEFPASSYARQLTKVAASAQQPQGAESTAQRAYADIYALYQANQATEALARAEATQSLTTGTTVDDKLALLRAMLIGKVRGTEAYRQALAEFVRDYPASPLLSRVKEMQAAADQPSAKRK
ncbi:type IX secretion system periplasmic lipoprotein PorW/SprE [Tellurirhabdus rosea]|uniref:type IX secretion system periplasmic lipoprotein PorW/SprE n=1 Tax=Tellurirhabdus rosea TaxID=2674997 RepID=UPI002254F124|nr:hypothetical protein [Tellurirhabdus rosea]